MAATAAADAQKNTSLGFSVQTPRYTHVFIFYETHFLFLLKIFICWYASEIVN